MTDTAPLFQVTKGNPTDTEVAALTAVLTKLSTDSAKATDSERNLWGRRQDNRRDPVFNPNAFRNVTFY